jgi:hypothetical protein
MRLRDGDPEGYDASVQNMYLPDCPGIEAWLGEKLLLGARDAAADPAIRRSVIDADRSLLHVSATRAKKRLFVSSSGTPGDLIAHLGVSAAAE